MEEAQEISPKEKLQREYGEQCQLVGHKKRILHQLQSEIDTHMVKLNELNLVAIKLAQEEAAPK